MNEPIPDLLRRAAAWQREGRGVTACLLVRARGSTPQTPGALMLVDDAAATYGTIGGGCVEAEVRREALALIAAGKSRTLRYKLDHDYGWDDGLICGGTIELAVGPFPDPATLETIIAALDARRGTALDIAVDDDAGDRVIYRRHLPPCPRLYIAGAGHVGQALVRLARRLDFEITVFDDRPDLLDQVQTLGAQGMGGSIAARLAAMPIDAETYAVIVTRGHRHDAEALAATAGRGARFVGMIGSRRKVKVIFDDLVTRGTPAADLEDVEAPIGLDIGSVTVEEIAMSIAARLVQVRRAEAETLVEGPLPHPAPAASLAS
ncbi:MAG: XdhC family protein [Phycisphaerales bacterium]|nr:XdhC family protein [Phycisphaerae bacterium]NNF44604.1 XdhC family protein [Phycisphaerales bacterium]NNM24689.1 XdhC family protein [Phycisphaerales bacterium]